MWLDVRCKYCRKKLGEVSANFFGVIKLRCGPCKRTQQFSLADLTRTLANSSKQVV